MLSARFCSVVVTTALFAISPVLGATPLRVRGSVAAVDDTSLTVREETGRLRQLATDPTTAYAGVVPSSIDAVGVGSYVGSAVKGPVDHLVAVEMVLVPESMRAGRLGYYAWDPLPDTSGLDTSGITATTMTNGSVLAVSRTAGASKTNGTVTSDSANAASHVLTVNLADGKKVQITVLPRAPIVQFVPADRSALALGSAVVVWTRPGDEARLIAIGQGVKPPM